MNVPSSEAEPDRYIGRPLVLILENYILDVIGELTEGKQSAISSIVAGVFGGGDNWRATIRRELRLEEGIDANISELWRRNQEIAAENGIELLPIQFAKMVVDTNFADRIRRGEQQRRG